MRSRNLLYCLAFALWTASAFAQTFTVDQPANQKKTQHSFRRPDEIVVTTDMDKSTTTKAGKKKQNQPNFEESVPAAGTTPVKAHHDARRSGAKTAKKVAPPPPPPVTEPPVEEAKATVPAKPKLVLEPVPSLSSLSDSDLRQQIEQSLRNDPNIPNASKIQVSVSDTEIRLNGSVPTGREKVEAVRLAQSFSGNRNFKDNVQVADSKKTFTTQPLASKTGMPTTVGNNFQQRPK